MPSNLVSFAQLQARIYNVKIKKFVLINSYHVFFVFVYNTRVQYKKVIGGINA